MKSKGQVQSPKQMPMRPKSYLGPLALAPIPKPSGAGVATGKQKPSLWSRN